MAMTKAKQIKLAAISGLTNTVGDVQGGIEAVKLITNGCVQSIGAGSVNYLNITGSVLTMKAAAITNVTTDNTYATLAAWITGTGYTGTQLQEGDTLVLAAATGGTLIYMRNAISGGTAADFIAIESPDVTPAYIRSQLSGGNGISYNSTSGAITVNINATSGLEFSGAVLTVNVDDATIEKTAVTGDLKIKADGVGTVQINNAVGQVDAQFLLIDNTVAGVTSGGTIQDALEALDAKPVGGTRTTGSVACPVQVASTNFTVTLPSSPIATQAQVYSINGIRTLPVSVVAAVATFNVGYAVDATDAVEYEYFA